MTEAVTRVYARVYDPVDCSGLTPLCGLGGPSSWCVPDKVEFIPHQRKGNYDAVCDGEQMPTATSHRWNTACAMSHNVADLLFYIYSALLRRVKKFRGW